MHKSKKVITTIPRVWTVLTGVYIAHTTKQNRKFIRRYSEVF